MTTRPLTMVRPRHVAVATAVGATAVAVVATRWWLARSHPRGWESQSTYGRDLAPGSSIALQFNDNELEVHAGGNRRWGTYYRDGNQLFWCDESGSTLGCRPDLAVQDHWLCSWLSGGVTVTEHRGRLELYANGVTVVFAPTRP